MKLFKPTVEMEDSFMEMVNDYQKHNEKSRYDIVLKNNFSFRDYIYSLEMNEKIEYLKPDYAPSSTFWLMNETGVILGVSRLRFFLVPSTEQEGGHIGYDVPPSQRKKGYGYKLLELSLRKAKEISIDKLLITCDSDNTGSKKIIEFNGGVLENTIISDDSGKEVNRYWIKLN